MVQYVIAHCTIWTVAKGVTNLRTEYEATEALAEVALLSLNSVVKTGIQCSSLLGSSQPDSVDLPKLSLASGKPSQRFLRVLGVSPKSLESSSRKARCSLGFLYGLSVFSVIPEYLSIVV